jgi:predicted regulator of Ras-like GTPase activity (Roadblock/LC7/MglB family)
MLNSVKSKFAGFLRGLVRRADELDKKTPNPVNRPVAAAASRSPQSQKSAPAAKVQPAASPAATSLPPGTDVIALPVAPVVAGLPNELRAKILKVPPPGMTFNLPVETVTSQLASGAVKITFGDLRRLVPGIFANAGGELDLRAVSLPLDEILPRMNPALLSRRTTAKVLVAEEIPGPFANRCAGVTFTSTPLKAPAPAAPSAPPQPPAPIAAPLSFAPPPAPRPVTPPAVKPPSAPAMPKPVPGQIRMVPTSPLPPTSAAQPAPKFQAAPVPVPSPAPKPVALRPEPALPAINIPLWELAESWPDELKQDILTSSLANEVVALPGDMVEAGLKQGRIKMTWRVLRTLAKPGSNASPNDGLELELPLKVVAPLFLAVQKNAQRSQRKAAVSEEIPNLFFGFPQAAPAPAAPVAVRLAEKAPEKKISDSNIFTRGDSSETPAKEDASVYASPEVPRTDFTSRRVQPKDVVSRAKALPGVAGVVVALPDGLRVASDVPPEMNAETLAAFIPQLFDRMNLSVRELRLGVLNNVAFTVGNVPWKIFRVNAVYVAAFGHAGKALPGVELAALAAEMDRKKQE